MQGEYERSSADLLERAQAALDQAHAIRRRVLDRIQQSAALDMRSEAAASRARAAAIRAARLAYRNDLIELRDTVAQLEGALKSRAVIEQAKGVLMAHEGCSPDDAFQMLVRASQRENRKLHDIARDLVERAANAPADQRLRPDQVGER